MSRNGAVSWNKSSKGRAHSKCDRFEIFPVMKMGQKSVHSFTLIDHRHNQSYKNIQSQGECKNKADNIIKSENKNKEERKISANKLKINTIIHPGEHYTVAEETLFVMETPEGKQFDIYYEGNSGGIGIRAHRGAMEINPTSSNAIVVKNTTLADEMEKGRK